MLEGRGLSSNAYFFDSPKGVLCIDAGADAQAFAKAGGADKVLLTHGHADHWLAAARQELCLHAADVKHFTEINSFFGSLQKPKLEKLPKKIEWGSFSFKVVETPGHTPGSVCFFEEKRKWLFSGDMLFAGGGCGRTDLPCGDYGAMQESLAKLEALDYELLLPGHGSVERH